MKQKSLFLLIGLALAACGQNNNGHQTKTIKGEFVYSGDQAWMVTCDSNKVYDVTGPALDELKEQYSKLSGPVHDYLYTELTGYFASENPKAGKNNTAIFVTSTGTINNAQHCIAGSNLQLSGNYQTDSDTSMWLNENMSAVVSIGDGFSMRGKWQQTGINGIELDLVGNNGSSVSWYYTADWHRKLHRAGQVNYATEPLVFVPRNYSGTPKQRLAARILESICIDYGFALPHHDITPDFPIDKILPTEESTRNIKLVLRKYYKVNPDTVENDFLNLKTVNDVAKLLPSANQ